MPAVCLAENVIVDANGLLRLAPWSVPRNVVDINALSGGDTTKLTETSSLPGRLLIDQPGIQWHNDTPVDHQVRVTVTRRWRRWVTSNPNAVEFRDRWTWAITDAGSDLIVPDEPFVTGIFNSQCGSAGDVGTNTVAEPNPGKFWHWWGTNTEEEWIELPIKPGDTFTLHYRSYVWTPPPFSNNANKSTPNHEAEAGFARIQLMVFPEQGVRVIG